MIKIAYLMQDFMVGGIPTFLYNLASNINNEFECYFIATDNKNINPRFYDIGIPIYLGNDKSTIVQYLKNNKIKIVQYGNKDLYRQCAISADIGVIIERTAGPRSCGLPKEGVSHVVASTNGTVPLIRKNYDGPLSVIYNGVDLLQYNNSKIVNDKFTICYCARIGGVGQGFQYLIPAVIEARRKSHKDIKLILIGDKPAGSAEDIRPLLKKLARPLDNDCIFTGQLLDPIPTMASADLYCSPALHHGISNSIIESCALSKPVIATNVGSTDEIVHHGKNGYLIPPKNIKSISDCIIKLIGSPNKLINFGSNGRKIVENQFNIKIQSKKYTDLYKKLLYV